MRIQEYDKGRQLRPKFVIVANRVMRAEYFLRPGSLKLLRAKKTEIIKNNSKLVMRDIYLKFVHF